MSKDEAKESCDPKSFAAEIGCVLDGLSERIISNLKKADCFRNSDSYNNCLPKLVHIHRKNELINKSVYKHSIDKRKLEIIKTKEKINKLKEEEKKEIKKWKEKEKIMGKKHSKKLIKETRETYQVLYDQLNFEITMYEDALVMQKETRNGGKQKVPAYVKEVSKGLRDMGQVKPFDIYEIFIADVSVAKNYQVAYNAVKEHAKKHFLLENMEFVELKVDKFNKNGKAAKQCCELIESYATQKLLRSINGGDRGDLNALRKDAMTHPTCFPT